MGKVYFDVQSLKPSRQTARIAGVAPEMRNFALPNVDTRVDRTRLAILETNFLG